MELTPMEKRAIEKGLAVQRIRLKAGRIIWDELEKVLDKDMRKATGDESQDAERLSAFKKLVEKKLYYEQFALVEWLEAQIDSYPDVLGSSSPELSKMMKVYVEHLNVLKPPKTAPQEAEKEAEENDISAIDSTRIFD